MPLKIPAALEIIILAGDEIIGNKGPSNALPT